ncbi:hypothetical protein GJW95_22055, partial [Salmonella enterica]|nr:hypothetical protein [Salmonella enterica]
VDVRAPIPPSFRDRLLTYTAKHASELHEHFILAETFKDYFKENAYPDLLVFEDDIASISSLIIIFLESPGSLVELGIFCNKSELFKKILIVASAEEVSGEDSFIYLGPLEYIKKKVSSSVVIYPWPDPEVLKYDNDFLDDLCVNIKEKLSSIPKTEQFSKDNSGHIALLITEIISLCAPIQLSEIESALNSLGFNISTKIINRSIYLLQKVGFIDVLSYSSNKYYFPLKERKWVKFGKTKDNKLIDNQQLKMKVRQSFVTLTDPLSKRRITALRQIIAKKEMAEEIN